MEKVTRKEFEIAKKVHSVFKQLVREKGSRKAVINYLISETGLPAEECELAYNYYSGSLLPENFEDLI